eukprot:12936080-Prorocentrum_lima.AAC.1
MLSSGEARADAAERALEVAKARAVAAEAAAEKSQQHAKSVEEWARGAERGKVVQEKAKLACQE